jgi:hypothetical protein
MSTTTTPTHPPEGKPSLINRILPGIASKKEKGVGTTGPFPKIAGEVAGAQEEPQGNRVRLYVAKLGKNQHLLQARRQHDAEGELVTVRCKNSQAFKVKTYIEAEADADGTLYIVDEKRWLRFQP